MSYVDTKFEFEDLSSLYKIIDDRFNFQKLDEKVKKEIMEYCFSDAYMWEEECTWSYVLVEIEKFLLSIRYPSKHKTEYKNIPRL
jgi:hypothetical protein